MNFQGTAYFALPIILFTTTVMLLSRKWRFYILCLAIQYIAAFLLTGLVWSTGMAALKLVVGWMATAVIASTQTDVDVFQSDDWGFSGMLLRLIGAFIIWVLGFSIAPQLSTWVPAGDLLLYGGVILSGMGLLQLGMTQNPLRVIGGLLTLISGFEILYAVVETSMLVAGLLALVNLGLALIGAYFILLLPTGEKV